MTKSSCAICGNELENKDGDTKVTCSICKKVFDSKRKCRHGHYICNDCHKMEALEYIETYCKNTFERNPVKISLDIMGHSKIYIHGVEHHYLVPAVLLTAYCNSVYNKHELIGEKLKIVRERSKNILAGDCEDNGVCGVGIGVGIFIAVLTETEASLKGKWKLSNLSTSRSLEKIVKEGGHKHCKRNLFLAIETATDILETHLGINLPRTEMKMRKYKELS